MMMMITEKDIGHWFETVVGKYVLLDAQRSDGNYVVLWVDHSSIVRRHPICPEGMMWRGRGTPKHPHFLDLVRKLDNLEVELLGLSDKNNPCMAAHLARTHQQ